MSERFEFVLGSVEAGVVGQALGVDVRRVPLRVRNTTTDPERLIKLTATVGHRLVDRGLATKSSLHPSLRASFDLFGNHRVSVSISGIDGLGSDIAVLALSDGVRAVGVTQRAGADELLFSLFSDDDFVEVLAGVLPVMPRASGGSVTVQGRVEEHATAWDARKAAERAYDEEETDAFGNLSIGAAAAPAAAQPSRRSRAMTDDDRLRQALSAERLGGGQILVSGRGAASRPLSWVDTAEGRYLVHSELNRGEFVATYEPAGSGEVARAVRDALSHAY